MEEKINLLYNFIYNDSFNNCFDIEKIQLGKIKIDDIKITSPEESIQLLKEVIDSKLSFISYDNTNEIIYLKRFSDSFPVIIKICTYKDDINNLVNFSNNDALFSYILSQLVINKKTKNILLPIINFDISFDKIEPLLKNLPIYKTIKDKVEYNEIKNILSVRIREQFTQSKILKEYLIDNACDYNKLLFQLIHTLALLQKEFPGFRHNNLTVNNVLVYINKNPEDLTYEFGNNKWILKENNFTIKITNFEKATLPKYYGIQNQRDTDVPYITEINEYFDLHTFLNSLTDKSSSLEKNLSDCTLETKKFIDKVLPNNVRTNKNGNFYLNKNEVLFKPNELLKDPYFNIFKNKSKDEKIIVKEESPEVKKEESPEVKKEEVEEKDNSEKEVTIDNSEEVTKDNSEEEKNNSKQEDMSTDDTNFTNYNVGKMTLKSDYVNILGNQKNKKFSGKSKKISKKSSKKVKKNMVGGGDEPERIPPWDPRHPKYDPNYKKDKVKHSDYRPKPWDKPDAKSVTISSDKQTTENNSSSEDKSRSSEDKSSSSEERTNTEDKEIRVEKKERRETETFKREPETFKREPETFKREPETFKREPERFKREPEKFKKEPETREIKREYIPDVKPWDKQEPRPEPRPQFKPREDLNPTRPTTMRPDENFQNTKTYDSVNVETPPTFIPLFDPNNNLIKKMIPYTTDYMQQFPVNKIYNISASDPLGNHSIINRVYEDVLPGEKTIYTFLSIKERDAIKRSLRNSILHKYDGEELTIQGGTNSLLSWIKIYDLNPYTNKPNPYDDLPYGFLLYRSTYPIKYSRDENTLKSTPTSIAINVRIYRLSLGANNFALIDSMKSTDRFYFDVWRELKYYQTINEIVKNKESPNFINILLYVFDAISELGFDKLNIIKNQKDRLQMNYQKENDSLINKKFKIITEQIPNRGKRTFEIKNLLRPRVNRNRPIPNAAANMATNLVVMEERVEERLRMVNNDKPDEVTHFEDISVFEKNKLIILTEAPNTNIIKWNSKVYERNGTVNKMISTGYHNLNVWRSILFQLVYSCAILQKYQFYFNNFSLENNFYIKDVQTDNTGDHCWLYKINKIDYYVPNYGYLLVVDSKYADLTSINPELLQFKIYGKVFGDEPDVNYNINNFKELVKRKLIEFMNETSWQAGGKQNSFEDDVKNLMLKIKDKLSTTEKIESILPDCFPEFFNNKIGKLITRAEKDNFSILNKPDYREGSLMIRQKRYDEYEWVIYKGETIDTTGKKIANKRNIIVKELNNYKTIDVFSSSLFSYPEIIKPDEITIIDTFSFE